MSTLPIQKTAAQKAADQSEPKDQAKRQTLPLAAVKRVVLYTDGGCQGNPGPGAWAAVSYLEPDERHSRTAEGVAAPQELSGASARTTNNQMELQAVIEGLRALPRQYPQLSEPCEPRPSEPLEIAVYTDSQYVKNGISSWIHNWKKNAWRTSAKKPVKNKELWQELERQVTALERYGSLRWHWVKGHAGHYYNERCDELVRQNFPG